jgi:hypothetical protein
VEGRKKSDDRRVLSVAAGLGEKERGVRTGTWWHSALGHWPGRGWALVGPVGSGRLGPSLLYLKSVSYSFKSITNVCLLIRGSTVLFFRK